MLAGRTIRLRRRRSCCKGGEGGGGRDVYSANHEMAVVSRPQAVFGDVVMRPGIEWAALSTLSCRRSIGRLSVLFRSDPKRRTANRKKKENFQKRTRQSGRAARRTPRRKRPAEGTGMDNGGGREAWREKSHWGANTEGGAGTRAFSNLPLIHPFRAVAKGRKPPDGVSDEVNRTQASNRQSAAAARAHGRRRGARDRAARAALTPTWSPTLYTPVPHTTISATACPPLT